VTGLRDISAIDARPAPVLQLCESGRAQIEEAAREVTAYADRVEFDPDRLEKIGDRLDLIQKLKKKYGGAIEEVIEFGARASAELERIEGSTGEIERLNKEIQAMKSGLTGLARTERKRASAARNLKKIEAELAHLGMKTVFTAALSQETGTIRWTASTARRARPEFLISPNPGEEPSRLPDCSKENFRIMLALKQSSSRETAFPHCVRRSGCRHRRGGC
jgi:DNA repair protein RecN (Recombination protein N)